jgi:hypothetical protein
MKKRRKEKPVTPMPTAEMNDCCKVVAQIKDRDMERAVAAAVQGSSAEIEKLMDRIEELEKLAFEKAKAVSGLEGEIAGLKHKLAEALKRIPVPAPSPAKPAAPPPQQAAPPPSPKKRTENCLVCGRECISMCPECKAPICGRQDCGRTHGHGSMYGSST